VQAGPVSAAVNPTAAGCRRQGHRGDLLGPWLDANGDLLMINESVRLNSLRLRRTNVYRISEVTWAPNRLLAANAAQINGL
jgi:hypothetical protein